MRRHIETGRVEVGQAKVSSTWQHNNAEGKATLLHLGIWRLAPVVIDDDAEKQVHHFLHGEVMTRPSA
jgi:hypothetical protein